MVPMDTNEKIWSTRDAANITTDYGWQYEGLPLICGLNGHEQPRVRLEKEQFCNRILTNCLNSRRSCARCYLLFFNCPNFGPNYQTTKLRFQEFKILNGNLSV